MIGLLIASGAFSANPVETYDCHLVASDGELVTLSATVSWAKPMRIAIRNSTTRKWPSSLTLVPSRRFGGQTASNLWEIVPEAEISAAVVKNVWFDTIIDGPRRVLTLVVRDQRLPEDQIVRSPLASGDCKLIDETKGRYPA